nr:hypothetical protein [Tanacetum cinerariifolium]
MYCPKSENEDITLPHYVISCDSLEVLKLWLYRCAFHFPDSTSLRLRAFRVLELESVYCYDTDLVKQFFGLCPLLEELTLIDCFVKVADTICVSSPNLKTLTIQLVNFEFVGRRGELIIEGADSLKKAVIFPEVISEKNLSPNLGKIFCELLAGMSHVVSLSINLYFIQCINVARDGDKCFPALFPNLKTLEKHLGKKYWVLADVETRRILTRHLKRVQFHGFTGKMHKLVVASHLLEHGNALEEMSFSWGSQVKYCEKSTNMMNILSKFYKASSNVKLISILGD